MCQCHTVQHHGALAIGLETQHFPARFRAPLFVLMPARMSEEFETFLQGRDSTPCGASGGGSTVPGSCAERSMTASTNWSSSGSCMFTFASPLTIREPIYNCCRWQVLVEGDKLLWRQATEPCLQPCTKRLTQEPRNVQGAHGALQAGLGAEVGGDGGATTFRLSSIPLSVSRSTKSRRTCRKRMAHCRPDLVPT